MPRFTLDQKKAHDHQRHISITAGAGSGKTSVLVSRYCDLLEYRGFMPSDIAAITFTEKAASELRSRIARELESRLSDESHQAAWEQLKVAREKFPSAIVSTIHGFCGQMLREFPIEAEISPTFGVISGYERIVMEDAALIEAIEIALADEPESEFAGSYDIARRIGRERMEEILRMMLWQREALVLSIEEGVLSRSNDEILDEWSRTLDTAIRSMTLNARSRPAILRLIDHLKPALAEQAVLLLGEAESAPSSQEFLASISRLLREIILTKDGKLRRGSYDVSKDEMEPLEETAATLKRALANAEGFLSADTSPEIHRQMLEDADGLLKIVVKASDLYAQRKTQANMLDFEDLQLALFNALQKPAICERVAGRFRHIMVDEFQDTNELQYRIVRSMARELKSVDLLTIVGDRKQSIYGFRGAEVEVFGEATAEMMKVNRDADRGAYPLEYRSELIEPASRDESLGVISLDASFRLLPGICAYVNAACGPIMRSSAGSEFGIEYEPLVCARRSDGVGHVEVLLAQPPARDDDESALSDPIETNESTESEMIARRIVAMVSNAEPLVWECPDEGGDEVARPVTFDDIAILCRKRRTIELLEQDLRRHGIPFIAHGSTGYFKTQEVYDVVNYLRTLLNYRDDIALLGLLRSPFFAVSDIELYRLSLQPNVAGEENNLWDRVRRRVRAGEASAPLRRAVTAIIDDRNMSSRIPVSILMKRILERTGWRGAVIGGERGEQIVANVEKLIDMAREFERKGFTNLFDFVERVSAQIEVEDLEAEAAVNTSRSAVRLMTMHAAKGLEFPVVFLPDLGSPTRVSTPPFFDKALGFAWDWTYNGDDYAPAITALAKLRRREKERAEEARIYYVALTRARDALVLSGSCGDAPTAETMLAWSLAPIEDILPDDPERPIEELVEDACDLSGNRRGVVRDRALGFLDEDGTTVTMTEWELPVAITREMNDPGRIPRPIDDASLIDAAFLRIGEIPARARGEIYSATQYLTYSQCPTKYYLKYRLGIPESLAEAWNEPTDDRDSEDGLLSARLFREASKRIDEMTDVVDVERIVDELLRLEPIDEAQAAAVRIRVVGDFMNVLGSAAAMERIAPAGSSAENGKELRIPITGGGGQEYVLGVIDRVVRDGEGALSFLQYKTLRLRDRDPAAVADSYLPQVRLYAWLLAQLDPSQRSIRGTILFTDAPDRPQDFSFGKFDLVRVEEEIRTAIDDIRAISYSGRRDLPLATPHCPLCPYWIDKICLLGKGCDLQQSVATAPIDDTVTIP